MTTADVFSLKFSKDGSPWAKVSLNRVLDFNTLKYSKIGSPWWGIQGVTTLIIDSGNIKRILKVDFSNVKTIINVEG
jgi:hypothetical protein